MNYNFDEIINRNGTDSVKWDAVERRWGRNDLIPMWVADMDFRTAPFVIDALKKRLEHEVLGYTFACKEWAESIINWLKERHGWEIREEMLTFTPGIVRGLAFAIHCFTEKGDKVMVMCVAINEAVELGKQYGGEDTAGFINGVLGKIA